MLNREAVVQKYIAKHAHDDEYNERIMEKIMKDRADCPDTVPQCLDEWTTDKSNTTLGESVQHFVSNIS